jgi:hypothetical protein
MQEKRKCLAKNAESADILPAKAMESIWNLGKKMELRTFIWLWEVSWEFRVYAVSHESVKATIYAVPPEDF